MASEAFKREHDERVRNGTAMLVLWASGTLRMLDALRNGDDADVENLERNARYVLNRMKQGGLQP